MSKLTDDEVVFILKSLSEALGITVFGENDLQRKRENLMTIRRILNGERENE